MQAVQPGKTSTNSTKSKRGVAMEQRMKAEATSITILMVLVLANCVDAQSTYACWNACYNNCVTGKTQTDMLSCCNQCLNSCIPQSADDFKLYCQIGCSLKRCSIPGNTYGASSGSCFDWCNNLCNAIPAP